MPRVVSVALSALLAAHSVAGSQGASGLNGLHPFKSRAASALRRLDPTGFTKIGQSIFGTAPSNVADHAEFGAAVSLSSDDGSRLAVGSPLHDVPNENGGGVFLYDDNGTHWDLLWSTTGDLNEEMEHVSLSGSGTRIAVRRKDTSPNYAEVFDISSGGVQTQVGGAVTGIDDGNILTLSPDGTRLALSSENNNGNRGRVEVFEWTGVTWNPIGSFDGLNAGDRLGKNTAFSSDGNRLAISTPDYDDGLSANVGIVKVFEYSLGSWSQLGADIVGTSADMQFGFSLDLSGSGSSLAVGSPFKDGSGTERGTVDIYVYNTGSGLWVLDDTLEGDVDGDKFGRSVSISDDGSRVAGSSYHHDTQTGQVKLFELVAGTWTQLGDDIDGEAIQDRFGYSISMTGDGVRVAGGSTRADSGGFSTGGVLVYDGPGLPTSSPSQVPSLTPSSSPSLAPSLAPSSSPSVSAAPSSQPSGTPSVSATSEPSVSPSSAPSGFLDLNVPQFSWDIIRLNDAVVAFNDDSATEEIKFNYNISRRANTIVVYEDDCLTEVPDTVVAVAKALTPTSPSHGTLDVDLDVKQENVTSSGIWEDGDTGEGFISLCIRVDLMLGDDDDDDVDTSVHFHETKIILTIDLTQGFTVSGVLDLDRTDAGELSQNATLAYNVFACQCNVSLACLSETLTQGDDVYICLETNATDLVFVGVDSLAFVQSSTGVSRSPITDGDADALTAVAYNGDKCNIRTQMTSQFFVDDDPGDVVANGVAVMAFANTGRRLRANIVYRDLDGNEGKNEVRKLQDDAPSDVAFDVIFPLGGAAGSSANAKKMTSVVFMALSGAFFFV